MSKFLIVIIVALNLMGFVWMRPEPAMGMPLMNIRRLLVRSIPDSENRTETSFPLGGIGKALEGTPVALEIDVIKQVLGIVETVGQSAFSFVNDILTRVGKSVDGDKPSPLQNIPKPTDLWSRYMHKGPNF